MFHRASGGLECVFLLSVEPPITDSLSLPVCVCLPAVMVIVLFRYAHVIEKHQNCVLNTAGLSTGWICAAGLIMVGNFQVRRVFIIIKPLTLPCGFGLCVTKCRVNSFLKNCKYLQSTTVSVILARNLGRHYPVEISAPCTKCASLKGSMQFGTQIYIIYTCRARQTSSKTDFKKPEVCLGFINRALLYSFWYFSVLWKLWNDFADPM